MIDKQHMLDLHDLLSSPSLRVSYFFRHGLNIGHQLTQKIKHGS